MWMLQLGFKFKISKKANFICSAGYTNKIRKKIGYVFGTIFIQKFFQKTRSSSINFKRQLKVFLG